MKAKTSISLDHYKSSGKSQQIHQNLCINLDCNLVNPYRWVTMNQGDVTSIENVTLIRRGFPIFGTLILSPFHLVFSFTSGSKNGEDRLVSREIWICYPVIDRMHKARGSTWMNSNGNNGSNAKNNKSQTTTRPPKHQNEEFDHYTASHIRLQCKDFTYYSFDFLNDSLCTEVYMMLSNLITKYKAKKDIRDLYAYYYCPNTLELRLETKGWTNHDPVEEFKRQGLISDKEAYWRVTTANADYKLCPSYPSILIIPSSISDNVLKHASKFRSKQRIPAVVYRHNGSVNKNVIARCSQPLVGLNLQNRSIQDEKLIGEIFSSQEKERLEVIAAKESLQVQPQKNLIVDLRPITNAMAQHALGAGTESIDYYRGKRKEKEDGNDSREPDGTSQRVEKIFCNIENIHVMRDSLNKLNSVLNELDRFPISSDAEKSQAYTALQQALTKTQWLHRLSIILQAVDRIIKSVHLNNTNVVIHCSDGWDRTSQVSALLQLCLDPYYRTMKGFMTLIDKEWISFGFKFATRADHGGCIGAHMQKQQQQNTLPVEPKGSPYNTPSPVSSEVFEKNGLGIIGPSKGVTSFLQRTANHIKNTASAAYSPIRDSETIENGISMLSGSVYSGSSDKSPIFHQFLDGVYQLYRQKPCAFEFNTRFLKRLFYHHYSCQYGTFLCDSERELKETHQNNNLLTSVWDYFNSRPEEFTNKHYNKQSADQDNGVLFFNFRDIKWWHELYGRSDEEMNGLSNSLERKFAQLNIDNASDPLEKDLGNKVA